MMSDTALRRKINIRFEGSGGRGVIRLLLFIPKTENNRPVPAFLFLNNREETLTDPERKTSSGFWPAELIVSKGYAAAVIQLQDVDPDFHDHYKNGVHGILEPPMSRVYRTCGGQMRHGHGEQAGQWITWRLIR
jgi:hypothetical protein